MNYRIAIENDAESIALLHAKSWQLHYQDIFSTDYLENHVVEDRVEVWEQRLSNPTIHQHIILAEEQGILCGFACYYFRKDPKWGTLLDNLHVRPAKKNQGIGRQLLLAGLKWSFQKDKTIPIHLWVYESNKAATRVYKKWGGQRVERVLHENPDGSTAYALRYVWRSISHSQYN